MLMPTEENVELSLYIIIKASGISWFIQNTFCNEQRHENLILFNECIVLTLSFFAHHITCSVLFELCKLLCELIVVFVFFQDKHKCFLKFCDQCNG